MAEPIRDRAGERVHVGAASGMSGGEAAAGDMRVELNGERVELADGARVADAVARARARTDGPPRGVAVALDGEVVPRSAWEETPLREGQKVEVVGAIQGG